MEANESKFNISETVRNIRKAREELRAAIGREADLCVPLLTDYTLLPDIYKMFCELSGATEIKSVDDRKMFIFIVQYLYAPRNLFGCKMPKDLRKEIASVLGMNAMSTVSDNGRNNLFNYQVYTQFRTKVNVIFEEVVSRLRSEGKI